MLRGMEIASSVADSARTAVLQQVTNGVHVRMAVLSGCWWERKRSRERPEHDKYRRDEKREGGAADVRERERVDPKRSGVRGGRADRSAAGGGQILEIGTGLDAGDDVEVIDGAGQILLPGFVDMHTHLREPGREDTETIDTGSAAAALGGYTAVFAMANTSPVADSAVVTDHVWRRGQEVGPSTCTPSAQSRSASKAANSPRWRRWPPVSAR